MVSDQRSVDRILMACLRCNRFDPNGYLLLSRCQWNDIFRSKDDNNLSLKQYNRSKVTRVGCELIRHHVNWQTIQSFISIIIFRFLSFEKIYAIFWIFYIFHIFYSFKKNCFYIFCLCYEYSGEKRAFNTCIIGI